MTLTIVQDIACWVLRPSVLILAYRFKLSGRLMASWLSISSEAVRVSPSLPKQTFLDSVYTAFLSMAGTYWTMRSRRWNEEMLCLVKVTAAFHVATFCSCLTSIVIIATNALVPHLSHPALFMIPEYAWNNGEKNLVRFYSRQYDSIRVAMRMGDESTNIALSAAALIATKICRRFNWSLGYP